MPFNSNKVTEKIGKIEAKISRLEEKIHNLNQIKMKLTKIVDTSDFDRNPDGSIKFDQFGNRAVITSPAKDELTGEIYDDAKKIAIRDSLYSQYDTIINAVDPA